MRRKMKWRVLASACAAAMAVTSLPYMATQVNAVEPARCNAADWYHCRSEAVVYESGRHYQVLRRLAGKVTSDR